MSTTTRSTQVELMKTLDEKFISSPIMLQEAMLVATVAIDGVLVRDSTGKLDRALLERVVARAISNNPFLRLRLRSTPLGVTAPAWVDGGVPSVAYHLRFASDGPTPTVTPEAALAGRANGEMRLDHPLWDVRVAEAPSGDVTVIVRAHHAMGDGMYGLRILDAMTEGAPFDPASAEVTSSPLHSPRTGLGVLAVAYGAWLAEFPFGRSAWHEYWRKPFLKRMKRWAGRMLRSRRRAAALRNGLPTYLSEREYKVMRFDFKATRARARELGGSVNDLVVASALRAAALANPELDEVSMLVPISRKTDRSGDERNHISMARVVSPVGLSIAELVPTVRTQIEYIRDGGEPAECDRRPVGYATYLPWQLRPQFFATAAVRTVTLWPTIAPDEQLAVLASSYHDTITFAIIANREVDLEAVSHELRADVAPQVSEAS